MKLPPALLLWALAVPAAAQEVSYQKLELDHGLTVILHEDHGLPQVNVNVWYYVASKDEPARRSGFASSHTTRVAHCSARWLQATPSTALPWRFNGQRIWPT